MKLKYGVLSMLALLIASNVIPAADTLYDGRFKSWQEGAEKGDVFAQYSLGNAYLRGNEVNIDVDLALSWFEKAANKGHAKSQYKLGYLYYSGKGVDRDYGKSYEWFLKSAKQDYSPAQFYVGKLYADGLGVDQDYEKALYWLEKAKNNDYSPASREIVRVTANQQEAIQRARRAAAPPPVAKAEPKPEPKVESKPEPAPKPVAKKTELDLELLTHSNWTYEGEPAEILPSSINQCKETKDGFLCTTAELDSSNPFAAIRYKVETSIQAMQKHGPYLVRSQKTILQVLPSDPDDPEPNPEYIPATGPKAPVVMRCKYEDAKHLKCATDDFQLRKYER